MMFEESLSFNGRQLDTILSFRSPTANMENEFLPKQVRTKSKETYDHHLSRSYSNLSEKIFYSPLAEPRSERNVAAVKLQKVYKSFRTRRQLADCAVLAEQRWWRVLDFAELKRSSISFFDIEKPETALSRWFRARTRAAKVGKGLSKDEKARKLALQHWLEAIDPRHRYGHNLQFYYVTWLHCDSNQPFFYWLDIGDGKEVNLERCPRSKLLQQCIKYLGPEERKLYEVAIENGRLFYRQSGKPIHTTEGAKWIFVLSTSKTLYIGQKKKGTFQHSSFLAGGATLSAGRLVAEDGFIKTIWPHSGHYLPTEENFQEFISFLEEHNVNLTDVKKNPREDEEDDVAKMSEDFLFQSNPLEEELPESGEELLSGSNPSEEELLESSETKSSSTLALELPDMRNEDSNAESNSHLPSSRLTIGLGSKLARLEIPKRDNVSEIFGGQAHPQSCHVHVPSSDSIPESGYETAEESFIDEEDFMVPKSNLFEEDQEEEDKNPIPKEKIMKRIDSHKGMKSYQLANHLSTKWTTGAGPRIGCIRDYPKELQYQILEHQNLSPRTRANAPFSWTPQLSNFSPDTSPISLADVPTGNVGIEQRK